MADITYPTSELIPGYHECLKFVASERIYIDAVIAPSLEKVSEFQNSLIEMNGPVFYAVENDQVVGWCDIFPETSSMHRHRGNLGMGLLPEHRGKGLGKKLLESTLDKAKEFGLEKVELKVYSTNEPAIKLYQNAGFTEEGMMRRYRKLDKIEFDALLMAKFLT